MRLTLIKYIRTGFLWLATLTLLSHTLIPHHHSHDENVNSHFHLCIHESHCSGSNPLIVTGSSEVENCNHEVVGLCSINHEEINIPSRLLYFDYVISVNILLSLNSSGEILHFNYYSESNTDYYQHPLPSRGPPAFII
jgi:hypothetical protein